MDRISAEILKGISKISQMQDTIIIFKKKPNFAYKIFWKTSTHWLFD